MLQDCYQDDVEETLKELPESLDETYARMLNNIARTASRDRVIRLLQCLSMAIRPLRVEELAEVLALDFRPKGVPPELKDRRPLEDRQRDVLSMCSSLITLVDNDGSGVIQFSHYSVKEFLTSDRLSTSDNISQFHIKDEPAHTTLAQACLGTLLRLDGSSELKEYANQHWVEHAQFGTVSSQILIGMQLLFDSAERFAAWLKLHDIDHDIHHVIDDPWRYNFADRGSPLYYASLCGFYDLVAHIISEHPEQVNARGGLYHFPLVAALYSGHDDVAALLRQHDVDMDAPLQVASMDGRIDVVRWLLKHRADPDSDRQSPIYLATVNGHPEVVRALMEHSIHINAMDGAAGNVLRLAIFYTSPKEYRKKTGINFLTHPLMAQFQTCNNPNDIHSVLRSQAQLRQFMYGDDPDRLTRSLFSTVHVLHAFSTALASGEGLEQVKSILLPRSHI